MNENVYETHMGKIRCVFATPDNVKIDFPFGLVGKTGVPGDFYYSRNKEGVWQFTNCTHPNFNLTLGFTSHLTDCIFEVIKQADKLQENIPAHIAKLQTEIEEADKKVNQQNKIIDNAILDRSDLIKQRGKLVKDVAELLTRLRRIEADQKLREEKENENHSKFEVG
jgi:septal ring factor EnvC (AmiA/AmiB activator)